MKLYLCEKPSQAKDIANVLGVKSRAATHIETSDGIVTWAIGHLLELAAPEAYGDAYSKWRYEDLPILPQPFRVEAKDSTKSQLKAVGALIKRATEVVVATDADREGEMIARELLDHFKYSGAISRLWLSALDAESIRKGLARLKRGEETEGLYLAAMARSKSDWLVGMNLTRAVTLRLRQPTEKGVISIGRVQTPTLALVVRRDREIENFKPRDYFEIVADVTATNGASVTLRHAPRDEDRILDRAIADSIAARAQGSNGPLSVTKETKTQAPPKLFSLSDFQMKANARFGWSAAKSLKIAQSLYETHKATTYPRTDCSFLPEEQASDVPTIVANLLSLTLFKGIQLGSPKIRKTVFNTSQVTAHHAIIPTLLVPPLSAMSDDEANAYLMIAQSYLAALMPDYIYEQTRITLIAGGAAFTATGTVPTSLGWRSLYAQQAGSSDDKNILPSIPDGTNGTVQKATVEGKKTEPPSRYTEGTLLADMKSIAKFVSDPSKKSRLKETSGIGTEATRANIIATLIAREFVTTKGKQLISSPKGRKLIGLLESHLPHLADPGETAVWEDGLESIATGKLSEQKFVSAIGTRIETYLKTLSNTGDASLDQTALKPTGESHRDKPISDAGTYWVFGSTKGVFPKTLAKRPMSISDYRSILDCAPGQWPSFKGFRSKTNKPFEAQVRFSPERLFNGKPSPGVEFVFPQTTSQSHSQSTAAS